MLKHLVTLSLVQRDTQLVFVLAVDVKFALHVSNLAFKFVLLLLLSNLPGLMLLFLECLEGERVVSKRVLDVPEVSHICD